MKKLIITADDFGLGHEQNVAIDYAMRTGLVTQASLAVTNGEYTREAVEMAKKGGYADKLCLHLCITAGKALSEDIKKVSIYYKNDNFIWRRSQGAKILLLPLHVKELRKEFEAQIKEFLSYGLTLKHVDSHHYIHFSIPSFIALYPLTRKYSIKSVRAYTRAKKRFGETIRKWRVVYYGLVNKVYRLLFKNFVSYASPAGDFIKADKSSEKYKCIEVYTHPFLENDVVYDLLSTVDANKNYTLEDSILCINALGKYEKTFYNEI